MCGVVLCSGWKALLLILAWILCKSSCSVAVLLSRLQGLSCLLFPSQQVCMLCWPASSSSFLWHSESILALGSTVKCRVNANCRASFPPPPPPPPPPHAQLWPKVLHRCEVACIKETCPPFCGSKPSKRPECLLGTFCYMCPHIGRPLLSA